jgi:hypothetical protein
MAKHDTEHAGSDLRLQRREFLMVGSAAAVGLAVSNLQAKPQKLLRTEVQAMPLSSVGFWGGAANELIASAEVGVRPVIAADRLGRDSSLANGVAKVTIHGFWRSSSQRQPVTLALHAHSPVLDPATLRALPFVAWSWSPGMRVANQARFDVPVDRTLDVTLERLQHQLPRARRVSDWLGRKAGASRSEVAKLPARGVYFLALRENENEPVPSWSLIVALTGSSAQDARGQGVLRQQSLTGLAPVPFSYLMVSVA